MTKMIAAAQALVFTVLIAFSPIAASADEGLRKGTFTGASDHVTTGGVTVFTTADGGAIVILDTDFSLDGAPDPRVGFGKDGEFDNAADLGKLENLNGLQVYKVPASVDVSNYDEVYIWCLEFAVPLGVAGI